VWSVRSFDSSQPHFPSTLPRNILASSTIRYEGVVGKASPRSQLEGGCRAGWGEEEEDVAAGGRGGRHWKCSGARVSPERHNFSGKPGELRAYGIQRGDFSTNVLRGIQLLAVNYSSPSRSAAFTLHAG
jgi:hypothetical protein